MKSQKGHFKLAVLTSAVILGLSGCFGSSNSNKLNNDHASTEVVAHPEVNVEVYAYSPDDSIELVKQDGTVVSTANITEEKITFTDVPKLPANTPLFTNIKDAEGNVVSQSIYSADEIGNGVAITPLTTLLARMLDSNDTDVLTARDQLIGQMAALGMISDDDWNALESDTFDNEMLYGHVNLAESDYIQDFVDTVKAEIDSKDISSSTMQAGFPNAHGGIAELRVIDNGVLSFMGGESGSIPAAVFTLNDTALDTDKYTLSLEDAPSWIQISDNDVISFQAPEVAQRSEREGFIILATPTSGAAPKSVQVSYAVNPAKVLLEGSIGPAGGKIENDWKDIYLTAEAGALSQEYQYKLIASLDEFNSLKTRVETIPELKVDDAMNLDLTLPDITLLKENYFHEEIKKSSDELVSLNYASNNGVTIGPASPHEVYHGSNCVKDKKHKGFWGISDKEFEAKWPQYDEFDFEFKNILYGSEGHFSNLSQSGPEAGVFQKLFAGKPRLYEDDGNAVTLCSSRLWGNKVPNNPNVIYEPVLFVHGYAGSGELGGYDIHKESEYWGAFPNMISKLEHTDSVTGKTIKYLPYLFEWRTNQRFDDASRELGDAIKVINDKTNKQVHIVAHSFGGLLSRSLIQGISQTSVKSSDEFHPIYNQNFSEKSIASLTTIGTPHSGVANGEKPSLGLPNGRDKSIEGWAIEECSATTCYQGGADNSTYAAQNNNKSTVKVLKYCQPIGGCFYYDVAVSTSISKTSQGYIPKTLANTPYPNGIPTQVLIGVSSGLSANCLKFNGSDDFNNFNRRQKVCQPVYKKLQNDLLGDGLISFYGQRFYPNLKDSALINASNNSQGTDVTEHILDLHTGYRNIVGKYDNFFSNPNMKIITLGMTPEFLLRTPFQITQESKGYGVPVIYNSLYFNNYANFATYHHMGSKYNNNNVMTSFSHPESVFYLGSINSIHNNLYTEAGLENCKIGGSYDMNCNHATWLYTKKFLESNRAETLESAKYANLGGRLEEAEGAIYTANNNGTSGADFTQATINAFMTLPFTTVNIPLAKFSANEDGIFSNPIEFIPNSWYNLEISMPGFRSEIVKGSDAQISVGDTPEESNLDFGTIILQPNELVVGDLGINATNAFTGQQITGFGMVATNSAGNVFESVNGMLSELPRGTYNVTVIKDGYANSSQQCVVNAYSSNVCRINVMPLSQSSHDLVSVLGWGQDPRDLDTHMIKYDANGNKIYQIYYGDKHSGEPDNLDVDKTSGFGPETLSIQELDPSATYIYAVHHYAGSGSITSTSEARVAIGQRGKTPRILNAPTSGEGEWWKVYEVRNNILYPCQNNCMYNEVPTLNNANGQYNNSGYQPNWLLDMSVVINNHRK